MIAAASGPRVAVLTHFGTRMLEQDPPRAGPPSSRTSSAFSRPRRARRLDARPRNGSCRDCRLRFSSAPRRRSGGARFLQLRDRSARRCARFGDLRSSGTSRCTSLPPSRASASPARCASRSRPRWRALRRSWSFPTLRRNAESPARWSSAARRRRITLAAHKVTLEVPAAGDARAFFETCGYKLEATLPQHTFKLDVAVLRKFLL